MKIHFLVMKDLLRGGGIEKYTREVGSRLVRRGHEVTAFSTGDSGLRPDTWRGMRIVWLPKTRPYWSEKLAGAMMATLREFGVERPDLLHLHSVAAGSMAAVLRWRGAPCILQMHGVEWQRSRWSRFARLTLEALESASFRWGHVFTAVSKVQCRYYERRYEVPVEFIPTAADLPDPVAADILGALGVVPGQYFFSASRLVAEKGIHYLIEAFRLVYTDWKLVIAGADVGDGAYGCLLRELAAGDPRIQFTGHIEGEMLQALFCHAGAYVQPSEMEGMPLSLIEAMGHGALCVASDIPENLEALGAAGLSFHSRDARDLSRKLAWAIENPGEAAALGTHARHRVADFYTWDIVTDALEHLYAHTVRQYGRREAAIPAPSAAPVGGVRHHQAAVLKGRSSEE